MEKQYIAHCVASRALIAASLLAVAYGTASAQGTVGPPPVISPEVATLVGTVSVTQLSASQANRQALQAQRNAQPVEMPKHRLPDGSLTSSPRKETLEALPLTPEPNAGVEGRIPRPFKHIDGFTGITAGDDARVIGEIEPPDQGLAVHNDVVAEINNNLVQFFNSDGTALTNPIAASAFFLAEGANFSDTQAFFDPRSKRWFFDIIVSQDNFQTGRFGLAVSKTTDPLGEYFIYHIRAFSDDITGFPSCFDMDCFPDYPKAGYNADAFFITANLFNNFRAIGVGIYVLPKKKLEAGVDFNYIRFFRVDEFVVQPSVPAPGEPFATANNGTEYLLEALSPAFTINFKPTVRVIAIYNTRQIVSAPGNLQQISVDVAAEPYLFTVPSTQPNVIGPYCASVGVTAAPHLDGGLASFQATIQKAADNLYGVLPTGSKDGNGLDRDVLAWFILQPTLTSSPSLTANIVAQGYVVPPNGYSLSYPAFAINKAGIGVIGMSITNPDPNVAGGFPSSGFIQFSGFPRGNIIVTGQGATSDDGFTGCVAPLVFIPGRWGDYGAATVDAATGFFYIANEYIPDPTEFPRGFFTNWGTFITRLERTERTLSVSTE
jgi:hypothetical protein